MSIILRFPTYEDYYMLSSLVWHFADEKATFAKGRVLGLPLYFYFHFSIYRVDILSFLIAASDLQWCQSKTSVQVYSLSYWLAEEGRDGKILKVLGENKYLRNTLNIVELWAELWLKRQCIRRFCILLKQKQLNTWNIK